MGSRTGSSYTQIAGKGRYIRAEVHTMVDALEQGSETASPEDYRRAAIAGAKILIHTNPGLSAIYYSIKVSEKIIEWYPEMQKAYNEEGEQGVAKFLVKKLVEVGVNVAISYAINEVTDMAWNVTKSNLGLQTTAAQDNIAKFVIGESAQVAMAAAREGKPLDKDFFIKQAINVGLDCFINSLVQSSSQYDKSDPNLAPFNSYSKLSETQKKLLRVSIQEISHQISGDVYDNFKRQGSLPPKAKMKRIIARSIEVAYHEDVDLQKSQNDTVSFTHPDIIATDQVQIEGSSGKKIFSTNVRVNHRRLKDEYMFWFNPDDKIKKYLEPKHKDLLQIASLLYRLEYNLKEEGLKKKIKPKTVKIQVHSEFDKESREIIRTLATHLLDENQTISFEKLKTEEKETSENKEKTDAICLFSGGLDSLAGYYWAKEKYGSVKCIFVNHGIPKVSHMTKDIIKSLGIKDDFYSNSTQGGGYYLQQARGFLFLTAAAVYADIFKAKNVVLSECGVTKYLPSFSPSDETTKTTSPMMIKLAKLLYENKGINFKLHEPFEDSTKAEIISRIKDSKLLEMTHSCRKSNMRSDKHDCGYCLNCLTKVIGISYITGNKQEQFLMDPITNPTDFSTYNLNKSRPWKFNYEKYESIKQLINFSTGILSGGEGLHLATKRSVDRYGKPDLFRRFSEDVIYGLSYMKSRDMVKNQEILDQINRYESEKWFDKDRVMRRRVELLTGC